MPKFAKGSALGNPDLTLRADEPYKIKGSNEDEYRVFVLPTGLSEDRDLVGVEFRPGNRAILHHALLAFDTTGQARKVDASDPACGLRSLWRIWHTCQSPSSAPRLHAWCGSSTFTKRGGY